MNPTNACSSGRVEKWSNRVSETCFLETSKNAERRFFQVTGHDRVRRDALRNWELGIHRLRLRLGHYRTAIVAFHAYRVQSKSFVREYRSSPDRLTLSPRMVLPWHHGRRGRRRSILFSFAISRKGHFSLSRFLDPRAKLVRRFLTPKPSRGKCQRWQRSSLRKVASRQCRAS